jgi:hypothetical protein
MASPKKKPEEGIADTSPSFPYQVGKFIKEKAIPGAVTAAAGIADVYTLPTRATKNVLERGVAGFTGKPEETVAPFRAMPGVGSAVDYFAPDTPTSKTPMIPLPARPTAPTKAAAPAAPKATAGIAGQPASAETSVPSFTNIKNVADAQGLQPIDGMPGYYGNRQLSGRGGLVVGNGQSSPATSLPNSPLNPKSGIAAPITAEQAISGLDNPSSGIGAMMTMAYGVGAEKRGLRSYKAQTDAANAQQKIDLAQQQLAIDAPYKQAVTENYLAEAEKTRAASSPEALKSASQDAGNKQKAELFNKALGTYEQLYKTIYDGLAADPNGASMTTEQRTALAAQEAGKVVRKGYGDIGSMFFDESGKTTSSYDKVKVGFDSYRNALSTLEQRKAAGEFDDDQAYNDEYKRLTESYYKIRDAALGNRE